MQATYTRYQYKKICTHIVNWTLLSHSCTHACKLYIIVSANIVCDCTSLLIIICYVLLRVLSILFTQTLSILQHIIQMLQLVIFCRQHTIKHIVTTYTIEEYNECILSSMLACILNYIIRSQWNSSGVCVSCWFV